MGTGVMRCAAADAAAKDSPHNRKKELFDRDKSCINVGTLGASQHGKTTLSSAFTRVLSQSHGVPFLNIGDIDHTKLEKDNKHSQNTKNLYCWTDDWFVAHSDLPGLSNYAKNIWASRRFSLSSTCAVKRTKNWRISLKWNWRNIL